MLSIVVIVVSFIACPIWLDAQHLSTRLDTVITMSDEARRECAEGTSVQEEGYTVLRNFIEDSFVQELRELYNSPRAATSPYHYGGMREVDLHLMPSQVEQNIKRAASAFSRDSGFKSTAHTLVSAIFIKSSNKSTAFAFHGDADPYIIMGDTRNEYNFYLMLEKQEKSTANLGVVPVGWIRQVAPGLHSVSEGRGALRFSEVLDGNKKLSANDSTPPYMLLDDNTGRIYPMAFRMEDIECTPHLQPGDVLVLRGDVLHRTQPHCHERLSITIRLWPSDHELNVSKMLDGSLDRYNLFRKSRTTYAGLLAMARTLPSPTVATVSDHATSFNADLVSTIGRLPPSFVPFFVYYTAYIELRYWFCVFAEEFSPVRSMREDIERLHDEQRLLPCARNNTASQALAYVPSTGGSFLLAVSSFVLIGVAFFITFHRSTT